MKCYVYEWYVPKTEEIFYVGKGCRNRYKTKSRRPKLFYFYLEHYECSSRIIKWFDDEDDAFDYECKRITELKEIGMAKANKSIGGGGSYSSHWTDEQREMKAIHNPMREPSQRERMKSNNPMSNPKTALAVNSRKRKSVVINGETYISIAEASKATIHTQSTIIKWCRRGYDENGNPCRYANEEQKEIPNIKKSHPKATTPKTVIIDGIEYETLLDGANAIGGNSSNLIRAIKANRPYLGHKCEYGNQKPSQAKSDK